VCLALALARVSVASPVQWAGNGHYYEYIDAPLISWTAANAAANGLTYAGLSGHLATITSAEEDALVTGLTPFEDGTSRVQAAHLGGYRATPDPRHTDGWVWVTGAPACRHH
jgi:expansin (peptidoglycan-binding protein)